MNLDHRQSSTLIDLVQQYEAAGWLARRQALEYTRLLHKHPESQEFVAKEIQKAVAAKQKELVVVHAAAAVRPMLQKKADPPGTNIRHHSDSLRQEKLNEIASPREKNDPVYLEPSELKSVITDEVEIKQLFAEMCFFARLGFVQPPSCLRCAYKEGMGQAAAAADKRLPCQRWVVWRKNADLLLHPDTLGDNIIMFQCHVVRKLLAGKQEAGCAWDTKMKQLVQTSLV